ncbi:MAG: glycoside hydrolase family 15 protein [Candidatus Thermoplasmatota archaeon]
MTSAPSLAGPVSRGAYERLEDYGAIGAGRSVALVSRTGSIDWWCPARFDAPSVFGAILDAAKGGHYRIAPTDEQARSRFRYVPETNIIETTHTTASGAARVTDFAPFDEDHGLSDDVLVRRIEGVSGCVELEITFAPRFQYGAVSARFARTKDGTIARGAGELLLLTGVDLAPTPEGAMHARVFVRAGERVDLVLRHSPCESVEPFVDALALDAAQLEVRTFERWRAWSNQTTIEGPDAALVRRSALALKLLQCRRNGAIVAAPTTSLPEEIGGVRNWDYRYAWIRDGALCARALGDVGHDEEADAYARWLTRAVGAGPEDLRVMYSVSGARELPERVLSHLEGHRRSAPVRIGNDASTQHQLDVYGELFHFVASCAEAPTANEWASYARLADWVALNWRAPDSGIWEVRCEPKQFVLSKAMASVALDRAAALARANGFTGDSEHWEAEAAAARLMVLTEGYDAEAGYFVQAIGERHIDASNLLLALVGFIDARDPRMLGTVERIVARLLSNGLVYRYLGAADGVIGGEATFAYCTFWLVEVLARQGRVRDARALFDRMAQRATPLGLYAEEIDSTTGEHLGNFPQGFPHAGLISAALALRTAERSAE